MPRQSKSMRNLATFGELFRAARLERGVSQHQLAETLGVRQSAVSAWEAGESEPDRELVFRCEEIFNLTAGSLSRSLGYGPPLSINTGREKVRKPGNLAGTRQAILLDPNLDKKGKDALLATYRALVLQSRCTTSIAA